MKIDIKVPAMGESISEATVSALLKPNGTVVTADAEILELETDKLNQMLFAPQAGELMLTIKVGDTVTIGQVIGFIETEVKAAVKEVKPEIKQEVKQEVKPEVKQPEFKPEIKPEIKPDVQKSSSSDNQQPVRVSIEEAIKSTDNKPVIAAEMPNILNQAKEPVKCGKRQETRTKMSKIRQVIAVRLVEAQKQAAMLTTFNEVDMTQIMLLREHYKDAFTKEHGVKLGFMSFFVKAAVAALEAYPGANSYIEGDEIIHRQYYDIGIAVSTDRGLVVPVVRDCNHLSFSGIEAAIENYAKKARTGGLTVDDLTGGGFTITNGGVYGSLMSTPILNLSQSAILGMHKIQKRAVVVDDQIVIRPMMYLALSYDHRIIDGKEAVSFLVTMKNMLEDPARLLLEV